MENKINYKGYTINILQDENPESPREFDNLGKMLCFHKRYDLGDKHSFTLKDVKRIEANKRKLYIVLPLYLYDHSGITIDTSPFSCPWDSGQVGIIYVSKEEVRKEYGWKKITKKREEQIISYLKGEVKTYDNYLTGEVYGYEVEENGDSCFGFYGSNFESNGLLYYAKNSIDCSIEQQCENV